MKRSLLQFLRTLAARHYLRKVVRRMRRQGERRARYER
jgi:hypothetical protein